MTTIATDLRQTQESARRIRYEPTLPFTATNVQDAIGQANSLPKVIVNTPINFASSPYQVRTTDVVLLVDTSGGQVVIDMLPAAQRSGIDLTIKDDTGNAAANPISVVLSGAETIDGLSPYPMDTNFLAVTFSPQAGGYFVKP